MEHVRHGRTARDAKNLARHLLRREGNTSVEVVSIVGLAATDLSSALAAMRRLAPRSASAAFHHISLSPSRSCAADDLRADADRVLRELGVDPEEHPHALVVHGKTSAGGRAPCRAHLVVAHWDLVGQALADGWLHLRLERVAREIEHDRGEALTPGRHDRTLAKALRVRGRPEIATALEAAAVDGLPRAATTSGARQRLRRVGVDDIAARAAVKAAWDETTNASDFRAALSEAGLFVAPGAVAGVFIVSAAGGVVIGALDRIVRQRRAIVAARMEETENDRTEPTLVLTAPRPGTSDPHAQHRSADRPAPVAPGTLGGAGGAEPTGRPAGDANRNSDCAEGDGGSPIPDRGVFATTSSASARGRGTRSCRVRERAAARILVKDLNRIDPIEEAARRYLTMRLTVLQGIEEQARKHHAAARAPISENIAVTTARAEEANARDAERKAQAEAEVAQARRDALLALYPKGLRRFLWWVSGRLGRHMSALSAEVTAARAATGMLDARSLVSAGMRNRLSVAEEQAAKERRAEVAARREVEEQASLTIKRAQIAAELLRADLTLGALTVSKLLQRAETERCRVQAAKQANDAGEAVIGYSQLGPR